MKYLKLVNSFDEFAEQAAPGTVFYHTQEAVYYWLNLKSIWGYIGYDSSSNSFVTNGRRFSIIPSVPDPESLINPVSLTSRSFPAGYRPEFVTFKHSDFSFLPITSFVMSMVVECKDIPIPESLYIEATNMNIVLENADLFAIKNIYGPLGGTNRTIVINDSNTLLDVNCSALSIANRGGFRWKCERTVETLTEQDIFKNVPSELSGDNYIGWYNSGSYYRNPQHYPTIVDCSKYNNIKISLHSLGTLHVSAFYPYNIPNLANVIIDAKDADGKIDDELYEAWLGASPSKQFSSIEYENVTDFGTYYKPYMKCSAQLIPQDVLELCKTKYIEIFSHNTIIDPDNWSLIAAQNINLSGVKHFVYYKDGYPYKSSNAIDFTRYSQFAENGVGYYRFEPNGVPYTVVSTPKLSNVNLESYGGFHSSSNENQHSYVYFNTDDLSVNLGTLKLYGNRAKIYLADKDIYISGVAQEKQSYGDGRIMILKMDNLGRGVIHLKHFRTDVPPINGIEISALYNTRLFSIYEMIDVSELVDSENPTALDYYNTGITMPVSSWMFQYTNGYITRLSLSGSDFSYFSGSSSKLKCVAGGGYFYDNEGFIATAEDIENLFNAIPNRAVSGKSLSFSEAQFNLLTQEQIDYATGLGYSVVKHIS